MYLIFCNNCGRTAHVEVKTSQETFAETVPKDWVVLHIMGQPSEAHCPNCLTEYDRMVLKECRDGS